jgi:Protein O-mannosyl-transferase TMEM260-like
VTAVSALFGIGTAAFTYAALRELEIRPIVAAAFSVILGVAPVVFYYSVVAEVYSAHLFFMAAVLAMLLRWRRTASDVDLGITIVLLALSFTNHMAMAFLVPGMLWFVWKTDRRTFRRPGVWLFGVASLIVAMSSYGYLIWRAGDPATPFVEVAPETWLDLIPIWAGTGGSMLLLGPDRIDEILRRIPGVGLDAARQALLALPLAIVGFRALWRDAAGAMLGWWLAVSFLFAVIFASPNPQSFLPPMVFVLMVVGAVGAEWLIDRFAPAALAVAVVLGVVVAISIAGGARFVAFQSNEGYDERVRGWYADVPEDGVLAAGYTDAMAAFYLTLLEQERSDVVTISDYPLDDPAGSILGRYLAGEAVEVPHTGQLLEPGRVVYAPGRSWACDLSAAGFGIEPMTDELFRVLPLGTIQDDPAGETCGS